MAGTLSKGITLGYKTSEPGEFITLTNLQAIPDLGGAAEKVDVTTLADSARKNINGIKDYGDLAFTFLYEEAQFSTLNALTGAAEWKVTLPGEGGLTATFSGEPSVTLTGVGVNEALTYSLSIALNSEIDFI